MIKTVLINIKLYRRITVFLLFIMAVQLTACSAALPEAKDAATAIGLSDITETFENGAKYERGSVKVVSLYGSWCEMGRQYGKLMSEELEDVYALIELIAEANDENRDKVEKQPKLRRINVRTRYGKTKKMPGVKSGHFFFTRVLLSCLCQSR